MDFLTTGEEAHCLICFMKVTPLSLDKDEEYIKNIGNDKLTMYKDLHVTFLLRTLFEIPQERLTDYLVNSGGDLPSEWKIRLCSRCKPMVEKTKRIYQDMMRCVHVFRAAREELVTILRESEQTRKEKLQESITDPDDISGQVVEETRLFVCENDYGNINDPFKEGDLIAERLVTERMATVQRLREVQSQTKWGNVCDKNNYTGNGASLSVSMLHLCKDASGERFQCPLCAQVFTHLSKIKFHTIRVHLDHLFESVRLPEVSNEKFQSCCKLLLETITPTCENSFWESTLANSCSNCGKGFTDRRYLHLHWIQHHYQYLVSKLLELQIDPNFSSSLSSSSPSKTSSGIKPGNHQNKPFFTCSQCDIHFTDIGELKVHITTRHTEQYFPPSQFNVEKIPMTEYRSCCQSLFRGEKYKVVGNESSGCPFCSKTYTAKRYVYVHMLESHYDLMEIKLRQLVRLQSKSLSFRCSPEIVVGRKRNSKETNYSVPILNSSGHAKTGYYGSSRSGRIIHNGSNNMVLGSPTLMSKSLSTTEQHFNGFDKGQAAHFTYCSYSNFGNPFQDKPGAIFIKDKGDG